MRLSPSQGKFFFSFLLFFPYIFHFFWQIFKTITLEFSTDTPCIANVIPAVGRMHTNLVAACENENYSSSIHATLKIGLKLLNKYYSITDNSEVYQIAMGKSSMICISTI